MFSSPKQKGYSVERKRNERKFNRFSDLFGSHTVGSWNDMVISAYTGKFSFRTVAGNSDWDSDWNSGHDHRKSSEKKKKR